MSSASEKKSLPGRSAMALPAVGLLSVGLAVAAAVLGQRLGAERERSATLQGEVGRLQAENSALLAHVERQLAGTRPGAMRGARTPESSTPAAGGDPFRAAGSGGSALPGGLPGDGDGPASAPAPGSPGPPMRPDRDRLNALQDPAARDAMRRQQKVALHRRYPDLAEALGLSRENADRFIDLLVEQQMRKIDESLQLAGSGDARSSAEMKAAGQRMAAAQADSERELAAQFGPAVAKEWQTYQQGLGARMELRGLQMELVDAGMALTLGQRDDLVAAMVREQDLGAQAGSKKLPAEARIQQAEASYQRLQDTARTVLSPEQFARFDARQRQRLRRTTTASEAAARSRSTSP